MSDETKGNVLLALLCAAAFFAWSFSDYIDGWTDERVDASAPAEARHAAVYEQIHCQ